MLSIHSSRSGAFSSTPHVKPSCSAGFLSRVSRFPLYWGSGALLQQGGFSPRSSGLRTIYLVHELSAVPGVKNSTDAMVPARNSCNQTSVKLLEGRIAYDLALGPDLNHGFNSCEFLPRCPPTTLSTFARASEPTLVSSLVPCRNRACISTSTISR
jgi:hypothetical protein